MRYLFFCLFASIAMAQTTESLKVEPPPEATSSATLSQDEERLQRWEQQKYNITMNMLPAPFFSGGLRLAGEYRLHPRWALSLGFGRSENSESSTRRNLFDRGTTVVNTDQTLGIRGFILKPRSGLYGNIGYKWGSVTSKHYPGLLQGVSAEREDDVGGLMAGIGYRLESGTKQTYHWIYDFELNYEPGNVEAVDYHAQERGMFGATKAEVTNRIAYGWFPQIRIGTAF